MLSKRILRIFLFMLCALPVSLLAQVTTSNISGLVKNSKGQPLVGATIRATHTPTGTVYTTSTNKNGRYSISNMQSGGPYTLEITFVGLKTEKRDDVYLNLGDNVVLNFDLSETTTELTGVTVSGTRTQQVAKGGVETTISPEKMQNAPSVGRNLVDYFRLVPQVRTTFGGGISIAGQNNRYNQLMIDGATNNDNFGLSNQGTNGGQTGAPPISIDAIESIQVGISPYDVSLGNFTGGSINAITKSGTNRFTGSAYMVYRNEGLAGKTPTGVKGSATKLPDFSSKTFGFTAGGPIIKNKLFFFISGETQKEERPQPFDASSFRVASFQDSVNLIRTKLQSLGYEPGDHLNIPDILGSDKIATKLTWNVNSNHRLNLSYRWTKSERQLTSASTSTRINFFNNGYLIPSTTNSASAELNSRFTNRLSNKLLFTYTNVFDDRDPLGSDFPRVTLFSAQGTSYVFGTENFSTGNQLKQNNIAIFNEAKLNLGAHQLKAGIDVEWSRSYNLFVRDAYGNYTYNWVADFLADRRPSAYSRNFSLVDNIVGDGSAAAPTFNTIRAGFFLGDDWNVNERLRLTFGVRFDNFEFMDKPNTDSFFNKNAVPVISQYFDMEGAMSGVRPDPQISMSPRLGFVFNVPEENIRFRGGLGLYTGRVPLVWPGGVYNNTGITTGGVSVNNPNITFRKDPFNQWTPTELGQTVRVPSGQVDLIAKDFKLPKVLKTSIGFDKRFGKGWNLAVDLLFQKNINEVDYKNFFAPALSKNILGQDVYLNPGSTSTYSRFDFDPATAGVQNPYATGIFLITNAKKDKGFSYNFSTVLDRNFGRGWVASVSYGYGDSYGIFDGTSSQNNSQWRFMESVNGRNNLTRSRSDFAQLHRINMFVSKKFEYMNKNLATTISLFYNGQSGTPFSYTYSRSLIYDQNGSATENSDLIYVPKDLADWSRMAVAYTSGTTTYSVADQWNLLNQFIENDKYLKTRRGQFAERNGAVLPFMNQLDLQLKQDFVINTGKTRNKLTVQFDMFNFSNFLNRDWGRVYRTPNIDAYNLITVETSNYSIVNGQLKPNVTYRNITNRDAADVLDVDNSAYLSSRWRGQFTIRYTFN